MLSAVGADPPDAGAVNSTRTLLSAKSRYSVDASARVATALIAVPLLLVKALAETAVTAPTWCSAVDPHRPQAGTSVSFVMVVMF